MNYARRILAWCLTVFIASVIMINAFAPAFHKTVSAETKASMNNIVAESKQTGSEGVLCIDDNEDALLWRLRMLGAAEESVVFSTFDFRPDDSGMAIMSAIYNIAQRGIKVQLLIDGLNQQMFLGNNTAFKALCAHENIEVRTYNPISLKNVYAINYRMHDKYMIVDDRMYILGGRNINDNFLGTPKEDSSIDRELLVYNTGNNTGASYLQLKAYFTEIWNEPCVRRLDPHISEKDIKEEYEHFEGIYVQLLQDHPEIESYDGWETNLHTANSITLLSNGTHNGNKEPKLLYEMEQLAAAGSDVIIQTPYVIADRAMYNTLSNISENANVQIFLNAVESGLNPWGCSDYLNNKKQILNTGVTLHEVFSPHSIHTKTVLIDDHLSIVGSFNFDMRSNYLDTELMLVVDSENLNAELRNMAEEYQHSSLTILPDGTANGGEQYEQRRLPIMKRLMYGFLQIIILPFRHLL